MISDNKTLFVIPARGGSKGIPHKNIALLAGRPLIAYSIDVALQLADPSMVCLSTDDDEIRQVAESLGLPVPYRRPAEFAADTSGSREVILDAMDYYDRKGVKYDKVVLLQPTSPLRTADDVKAAIELYSPEVDMVVSVVEAKANPYYDCFETDEEGFLHVSKGDGQLTRRQDAPKAWQYNGAVYVINPQSLRAMPMGSFTRRVPSPMPKDRSLDIDTPLDLLLAETILNTSK